MILRDEIIPYIRVVFSFSRYISKIIKDIKKWFIQKFYNKLSSFYLPQYKKELFKKKFIKKLYLIKKLYIF